MVRIVRNRNGGSKQWGVTPRSEGGSEKGGEHSKTRGTGSSVAGFGADPLP